MEGLTELLPFLVEHGNDRMWSDYLSSCTEMKVFINKSNETVPLINSLLNESDTRLYGLKLLDIFLKQCPKSCVNEHVIQWIHLCLKGAQSRQDIALFSFSVLCSLLEASVDFADIRKQVAQVLIPKILDAVIEKLKSTQENNIETLKCLFTCLYRYGKSSGNNKNTIEKCLINLLISDEVTLNYSAKCFHLLAQCGPPGTDLVNYQQNWQTQQIIVINSLHFVLDQFYSDVNEILGSYNPVIIEIRKLDLPTVNDEYPLFKSHKLSRLYCSLTEILNHMLLDFYPTCKKIYPETILGLICRTLAVTYKSLQANISNSCYSVMSQLYHVHISAIKLFNSLILCLRSNLLPFTSLISKLFIQIFKGTDVDNWVPGRERPYLNVRCCGYKCLLTWLSVAKSCSFEQAQVNIIVKAIIKDVKCDKKVVSLNIDKKKGKGHKKASDTETNYKMEVNEDTCESALACLPYILKSPLSYVIVKNVQETVVRLIFEIQRSLRCDENLPPPYYSARCRFQLYAALEALCTTTHPQFPPPLHYANILFNSSSSDPDIKVQRVCASALSSLSHILRPAAPSFDFQSDLDSEIIPINPCSETNENKPNSPYPTQKNVTSSSCDKKYSQKEIYFKVQNGRMSSNSGSKSEICISGVKSLNVKDINEVDGFHNTDQNDELIDLADSSDESLILVDSQKIEVCGSVAASNTVTKRFENKGDSSNSEFVEIEDEDCILNSKDSRLHGKRRRHKKKGESEVSIVDNESSNHLKVAFNVNNSHTSTKASSFRINNSSDIEIEVQQEVPIIDNEETASSPRRSRRLPKSSECEIIINDKPKDSADMIIVEPDNKSSKTPSGNLSCTVTKTDNSDEVTIIESPPSPSRRLRGNVKMSPPDLPEIRVNSSVQDEVRIISDKEGPPSKRLRPNNDKASNVEKCLTDDEEEIMNSFVDIVPLAE